MITTLCAMARIDFKTIFLLNKAKPNKVAGSASNFKTTAKKIAPQENIGTTNQHGVNTGNKNIKHETNHHRYSSQVPRNIGIDRKRNVKRWSRNYFP